MNTFIQFPFEGLTDLLKERDKSHEANSIAAFRAFSTLNYCWISYAGVSDGSASRGHLQ
jgi:hypothetical protein